MGSVSQVQGSTMAQALSASDTKSTKTKETSSVERTTYVSGKTVGSPKLSEKAAKYYEQLKKKFSNMDFILVGEDQKQAAQAQAGSYGNPYKPVVLIDEDKIERMAEDEQYRKQYEGIIASSQSQLASMKNSLGSSVTSFGIQVDDKGLSSYFAVVDKSMAAQRERIAKKAAEKKAAKKADEKKAAKKAEKERLENKRAENRKKADGTSDSANPEDQVVVKASSIRELLDKVNDVTMAVLSDEARTEEERKVGQNFDFKL